MPDPIKKIKSHVFFGRKYTFVYADPEKVVSKRELQLTRKQCNMQPNESIVGLTDDNRSKKKKIIVSDKLEQEDPKELLRVLIDEAMHALDSTIDNDVVYEKADDLANFLWKCGYRRITSCNNSCKKKRCQAGSLPTLLL
jgi:hypothetical protein